MTGVDANGGVSAIQRWRGAMVGCLLKAVTHLLLRGYKNIAWRLNQFESSIIARMEASYCYLGDSGRSPVI